MSDLLAELILPWFKSLIVQPNQMPSQTKEGWELEPSEEDATLSLPGSLDKAHESTVGRLCELGPKVFLLCYAHSHAVIASALLVANELASLGVLGHLALL